MLTDRYIHTLYLRVKNIILIKKKSGQKTETVSKHKKSMENKLRPFNEKMLFVRYINAYSGSLNYIYQQM